MDDRDTLHALDAGFLYLESPRTPMHVGSLSFYDGGPWLDEEGLIDLDPIRRHIADRVRTMPRLRQRPVWPPGRLGRPHWVDDPSFDVARHVQALHLPPGSTEADVLRLTATVFRPPLSRQHPLWELWFVDGLADGRAVVIEKIHHALVDGIGGVDVAMMLLDVAPVGPPAVVAPQPRPPAPSAWSLLAATARTVVGEPLVLGRRTFDVVFHPARAVRTAVALGSAARSLAGELIAPRTSLNRPVGDGRTYLVVRRHLPTVRDAAHRLGGTVNEIALAAVTAGFHELFEDRNEDLGGAPLHALVPVSRRLPSEHEDLGNRVAVMVVPLPVAESDPRARFDEIARSARRARAAHQPDLTASLLAAADHLPEPLLPVVNALVHHQPLVNVVVTNVPGPPVRLYLVGAELLETFPLIPLARNLDVSVGILSYDDQLTLGLWADDARMPDLPQLVAAIDRGFDDLEALSGARPATTGRAPAGRTPVGRSPNGRTTGRTASASRRPTVPARTPVPRRDH